MEGGELKIRINAHRLSPVSNTAEGHDESRGADLHVGPERPVTNNAIPINARLHGGGSGVSVTLTFTFGRAMKFFPAT